VKLEATSRWLTERLRAMTFAEPVTHIYNPLEYARKPHEAYLRRWGKSPKEVVLLGMNPGPWGMAQTGVPFGHVGLVREWLDIDERVDRPAVEHPKRPITGFACSRGEVSGERLWEWARALFGSPERFFARFFAANYCPLCFMEASGRNRTPDKLPASEREPLFAVCDEALRLVVAELRPHLVVGVGAFAAERAQTALRDVDVEVGRILHPSPASPLANRGWGKLATAELRDLGVRLPDVVLD